MSFFEAPGRAAVRLTVAAFALAFTGTTNADAIKTVNGVDIERDVYNLYLQTRYNKAAEDATPQERSTAMEEITDIYLLTTQPEAKTIEAKSQTQAQLELQRRGLLAQLVANDYVTTNPATEDEIVAEYERQTELAPPEQFKARHILVETQAAAQALIEELNDGADFAELAKEKSTGPSGPSGGDLGWFPPDQMVKPFSDAVASLENGTFTQRPVQTQFGWHVILREDSRISEPPTLESVRDVVKQRIEQMKFQDYLQGLRNAEAS